MSLDPVTKAVHVAAASCCCISLLHTTQARNAADKLSF